MQAYNLAMSKPTTKIYQTGNWSFYNQALINRGNITLWFDDNLFDQIFEVEYIDSVYIDGLLIHNNAVRQFQNDKCMHLFHLGKILSPGTTQGQVPVGEMNR